MPRVCPSSHLVCLTNSSCLSIHQWLCHSSCLWLWVYSVSAFCLYISLHHQGDNYPSRGCRDFFPTRFVMLIQCSGCQVVCVCMYDREHVCVWQCVCVCVCVYVCICVWIARDWHRRLLICRGAMLPVLKKYIITFQMCSMSPRWSIGDIIQSDRCGTCQNNTTWAWECECVLVVGVLIVAAVYVQYHIHVSCVWFSILLFMCMCLCRSEVQELIYIIKHVHLCLGRYFAVCVNIFCQNVLYVLICVHVPHYNIFMYVLYMCRYMCLSVCLCRGR